MDHHFTERTVNGDRKDNIDCAPMGRTPDRQTIALFIDMNLQQILFDIRLVGFIQWRIQDC